LIKVYKHTDHPQYNQPTITYKRKIACSRECHRQWQLSIPWEDRIGKTRAGEIRKVRSDLFKIDNPSTRPGVADKISDSMKRFCAENPTSRLGKNNGFYGKHHSEETKQKLQESKIGKWSYNLEQKERQKKNTPKKENHPNWQGGIANGEYGPEFTQELKERIKKLYNHACQLCNITNVDLDVHHIDYNKTNNSKKNLIPLCKICHGKTNYNRKKWQEIFESKI